MGEGLVDFDRGTTGKPVVNNTLLLNKAKPNEKLLYIEEGFPTLVAN